MDKLYQAHFFQVSPDVEQSIRLPSRRGLIVQERVSEPAMAVRKMTPRTPLTRRATRQPVKVSLRPAAPTPEVVIQKESEPQQPSTRVIPRTPEVIKVAQEAVPAEPEFPAFERAILPVSKTPNWGIMRSASQWERSYAEMSAADFVPVPRYNLEVLTTPMEELLRNLTQENMAVLTAKLFYSTRFFGRYHLDSGEYEGPHVGIDLKLAPGTPIGAVAGGQVHGTGSDKALGNYVMILHKLPNSDDYAVSIYGHLQSSAVSEGQAVTPGQVIGYAGNTGNSESAHLHLQIDRKTKPGRHQWYVPGSVVPRSEWSKWTYHPLEFIAQW